MTATAATPGSDATPSDTGDRNMSVAATLDEYAWVTDYRMRDGVLVVDVRLDRQRTISAVERVEEDGASKVRIKEWEYLPAGTHTLRFDAMHNQSADVLLFTQVGLKNERAVELSVSGSDFMTGLDGTDPYVVGLTACIIIGVLLIAEALRVRFGVGQGGERLI